MEFHKFPWFPCISQYFGPAALASKKDSISYAFSMVVVLIFLPGHVQIWFSWKYWFQTNILGIFIKFPEILVQNQILEVLRDPWPARAGNLNIPIGILRFLSLPGPLRSLQNREIPEIFIEITFSHSKTGFAAPGPQKMAPERCVYVGFWQGPPMSVFGLPGAFLVPRIIKKRIS